MKFNLSDDKKRFRFSKEMTGRKKKRAIIYNVLLVFFSLVIIVCAYNIISYYWQEHTSEKKNEEIIEEVVTTVSKTEESKEENTDSDGYYHAPVPKSINFIKLNKKNSDTVGWIFSENGVINYPIVRGEDNDFYLNHSIDKKKNVNGSIFMNYKNKRKFTDKHTLIYGHSMKNGTMFATLLRYRNQSYYDAYPSLYLFTPYGKYRLDIFSAFETKDDDKVYSTGYNLEDYSDFITYAFSKSRIKADVNVANGDRLVTLSTCAYSSNNARFVVIAKLVAIEEDIPIDPNKPDFLE